MEIRSVSVLTYPREAVFRTYRDKLVDLVPYLPNIEKIEVRGQEEIPPHIVKLENHWYAKADIPKVAQSFIKPEMLRWIDRAEWNEQDWTCTWAFEVSFLKEYVHVAGRSFFTEPMRGQTEMTITGDLSIDMARVPGVPRFLASSIQPQVERFIRMLITPNLTTVNRGIEEYLRKHAAGG